MSKVFITGSTDGLGLATARYLIEQGHEVVGHARNAQRAADLRASLPAIQEVVIGDLSSLEQTASVADQVNALSRCSRARSALWSRSCGSSCSTGTSSPLS
jgi:NAD(P)-dependent dehydrogenase (short-subunit alcohol dehydrogenase family)